MHFTKIQFKNFGPFKDLTCKFKRGSVGVFGRNGTGKSTFINGLYALLTNDFRRFDGVKIDCIRNTATVEDESFLYGEIVHDKHTLCIKRNLRQARTTTEVSVDGGEKITDANKAKAEITRILGVDDGTLDLYVFKEQDRIYDFLSTTPGERAKSFAVLCRTEDCERVWEMLGNWLNKDSEVNAQITDNSDELAAVISDTEAKVKELRAAIDKESELLMTSKSEASANDIIKRADKVTGLEQQQRDEKVRLLSLQERHSALCNKREKLLAALDKCNTKLAEIAPHAQSAQVALKVWGQYQQQRKRRRQLKDERETLVDEEKQNEPPDPACGNATVVLEDSRRYLIEAKNAFKRATEIVDVFDTTGRMTCPTCGTSVTEIKEELDKLREIKKTHPAVIKGLQKQITHIEEYMKNASTYERWRAGFDARVKANADAIRALKELDVPEGDEKALRDIVEKYEEAKTDSADTKQALDIVTAKYNIADADLSATRRRLKDVAQDITVYSEAPELIERARKRISENSVAERNIARYQGQLQGVQQIIQDKEEQLSRLRAKLKRSKKIRGVAKIVTRVRDILHRDRLPRRVAQVNLARMEGDINANLGAFDDPFWVEASADLSFIAHKPGEPPQSARRLSTGQRVVLALSFWPAVASLWESDLGMLALDEPTANLDAENRQFLGQALSAMAVKVRGKRQLFLVTHDQNLRNAFDQIVDLDLEASATTA